MRLPRHQLRSQLESVDSARVVLLEAPGGYGKSWLLQRSRSASHLVFRGTLRGATNEALRRADSIVVDDVHQLTEREIHLLADLVASAVHTKLAISGRLVPDELYDAVQVADGRVLGVSALSVGRDEISDLRSEISPATIDRLIELTGGRVKHIARALDEHLSTPDDDVDALAERACQLASKAVVAKLSESDVSAVGLLVRLGPLPTPTIEGIAGPGAVKRLVEMDVPLRRQLGGALCLTIPSTFSGCRVDPSAASHVGRELFNERPYEVLDMLLDAGNHEQAIEYVSQLNESTWASFGLSAALNLLGRLGDTVEMTPSLLLGRASAKIGAGLRTDAIADVERAMELSHDLPAPARRRIQVNVARAHFSGGQPSEAVSIAEKVLSELGVNEAYTYARAQEVIASCLCTGDSTGELQRGVEAYRRATRAWDDCGEPALARQCRLNISTALLWLGRFDDALAEVQAVVNATDVSPLERQRARLAEAFILVNAARFDEALDTAERMHRESSGDDDARMLAGIAWVRAVVAAARGDREATLQSLSHAERCQPAGQDRSWDAMFDCGAMEVLGALGELDVAMRYRQRIEKHKEFLPDQVHTAQFIFDARAGQLQDVDAVIERAAPLDRWRVLLAAAYAAAVNGDDEQAQRLWKGSTDELTTLGLPPPEEVGEQLLVEKLRRLLTRQATGSSAVPTDCASSRFGLLGPLVVRDGDADDVAVGPPQRRVILAVLLSSANCSVPTDRLIDIVWNGAAKPSSLGSLQSHISRLRRTLGADRIVRQSDGYSLRIAPGEFDVSLFEQASLEGRAAVGAGDIHGGRDQLAHALELWRGDAYQDFVYQDWARIEAARLNEHRLATLEARIDADLALGRCGDLIGELEALVHIHPTRERFCGQLMSALSECGRQRDALTTYRAYRTRLIDESGLEPSPTLQHLHQRILRHDDVSAEARRSSGPP